MFQTSKDVNGHALRPTAALTNAYVLHKIITFSQPSPSNSLQPFSSLQSEMPTFFLSLYGSIVILPIQSIDCLVIRLRKDVFKMGISLW